MVAGNGGYHIKLLKTPPTLDTGPVAANTHSWRSYLPIYGYLKISVTGEKLEIALNSPNSQYGAGADTVVVDLATHQIIQEGKGDPDGLV
jgi:hypothetical protein